MPQVQNAPKEMNEMLESVYNNCMKKQKNATKERCSKIAWAAVKKKYRKVGKKWIKRAES